MKSLVHTEELCKIPRVYRPLGALLPPQAFLVFFLSAKSDWETRREQKGASETWSSEKFERLMKNRL